MIKATLCTLLPLLGGVVVMAAIDFVCLILMKDVRLNDTLTLLMELMVIALSSGSGVYTTIKLNKKMNEAW